MRKSKKEKEEENIAEAVQLALEGKKPVVRYAVTMSIQKIEYHQPIGEELHWEQLSPKSKRNIRGYHRGEFDSREEAWEYIQNNQK